MVQLVIPVRNVAILVSLIARTVDSAAVAEVELSRLPFSVVHFGSTIVAEAKCRAERFNKEQNHEYQSERVD